MARFTDDERIEITRNIADYIISTKCSTRKTAEHFNISNATVSTLMNELLSKMDPKKYSQVESILSGNKPKTVKDNEIKQRVIKVAELIKEGFTVEEISKALDTTINVINEDLQTRLPRISESLHAEVKEIQRRNSISNLKNVSVEGQQRDENGKFTK